jgi:hypothetical protein
MSLYTNPWETRELTLLDLLDTALNKGIVLQGDATISVADVDLVFLGLKVVLCSVETMENWRQAARGSGRGSDSGGGNQLPPAPEGTLSASSWSPSPSAEGLCAAEAFPPEVATARKPVDVCDPDQVERGLAKLVLTVVELLRRLLERQGIRRMDGGLLTEGQIERMGRTLQLLEQRMAELKAVFGLEEEELNLNLGPLGDLM